ncbi:hypothetical protein BBO99_00004684 [Phytophthora kernoviae]|uniref:Uncharacterized protein n=2 Tax=Phytophthora kernoviae TaxID=325452 RepID=A0A3R7GT66_9STRA|nr:hypothetical protein G195_006799 [Phytophthora kernoviae 00238/432]KAG2527170.1 hypothetical protein JM18_003986 [Phytophthora kernoviae]KAG2528711.1 hypothetical protein JM16_002536 [Phytophthora kernoviae]RLN37927.1 hypothetical protein BBI17_002921 [Phytophthora kernoviae]RLN80212.1 hypothetical protein BBO99_00004684 [Phytophthora kernoviae]
MAGADVVDSATALQLMRAKQNSYYIHAVQNALQAEEQRKVRLQKVANKQEAKRLEKQFARERSADREQLLHIQEDHALLLNAKVAEWKAKGGMVQIATNVSTTRRGTERLPEQKERPRKSKLSKETLDRLAVPRASTAKAEETDDRPTTSSYRGSAETSQALQFYKDVYRKQDRERLSIKSSAPTLNAKNLQTARTKHFCSNSLRQLTYTILSCTQMSDTELLRKKANLLSELHGVVSLEARLIQDDQCTIRSSVSSWKSSN